MWKLLDVGSVGKRTSSAPPRSSDPLLLDSYLWDHMKMVVYCKKKKKKVISKIIQNVCAVVEPDALRKVCED